MSHAAASPVAPSASPVAVVTGASRGIGHAICLALADAGWRVVAAVRSPPADAPFPGRASIRVATCDVADHGQVLSLFASIDATEGRLDALVNNAGVIAPIGRIADTDPVQWALAQQVNLVGAYHCTRAALPRLVTRGGGTIVDISSGAAHRPLEGWSAYCASKAALAMLTRAVHEEYGAQGIVAVGLRPGVVDTGMQGQIRASGLNPVSKLSRASLAAVDGPAAIVRALLQGAATRYAGQEIDVRDPAIAALAG